MTEPELRRLLLDAARAILNEPDTAFDLRKIAERAGKSRTAPYLVFGKTEEGGGLQALRLAVAAEGLGELVDEMASALAGAADPETGLNDLAAAYLAFAQHNPRLFRLMFSPEVGADRESPERPEYQAVRSEHARLERVIVRAIRVQAPGYLRDDGGGRGGGGGARFAASALWALLHGVATLSIDQQWGLTRPPGAGDPDVLARQVLRFLTTTSSKAMREAGAALGAALAQQGDWFAGRYWGMVASPRVPLVDERSLTSLRRARQRNPLVEGARILWIDDHPVSHEHEVRALEKLGARVLDVRSTAEALAALAAVPFDLVLSDIERHGDPRAGLDGLLALRGAGHRVPVVFYVGQFEPERGTPAGAFGITDDADELLHLVFDVLERR